MNARMPVTEALRVLLDHRRHQIVVTTMGATREWSRLSQSALDFHYLPSAMGHAPMIGLGLAVARPEAEVIVLNGDGSMLMGLGGLVTICASGAKNLTLVVLDNGVYEVTGGQSTPARSAEVDFAAIARGAGFATVATFHELPEWRERAGALLQSPGPRFIALAVEVVPRDYVPKLDAEIGDRIRRFQRAMGVPDLDDSA